MLAMLVCRHPGWLERHLGQLIAILKCRGLVAAIGVMTVWSHVVLAQQPMPIIGFLGNASPNEYEIRLRAFREGLKTTGFVEGQNVAIEYKWAGGDTSRLQTLAKELVKHQVAVLVAGGGTPTALASKAVTATIPIVFAVSADPVELGLVPNLNRPGGNLTGISNLNVQMGPKRLELVRELLPGSTQVAVLLNPDHPDAGNSFLRGLEPVAKAMGFQLHIFRASKDDELDLAFSQIADQKMDALLIAPDVFFVTRSEQLAKISLRHAVPTIYTYRPFVAAGGLMTYSSDEDEYYRLVGTYAGRILKGDKPGDLPVHQSIKVELIINLKTAKALGITVPLSLLGRADEVIE